MRTYLILGTANGIQPLQEYSPPLTLPCHDQDYTLSMDHATKVSLCRSWSLRLKAFVPYKMWHELPEKIEDAELPRSLGP